MDETTEICAGCLFRRDVPRFNEFMGDPADFYMQFFKYPFTIPRCIKYDDHYCLGAIIHVVNMSACSQLPEELKSIAIQYEPNYELIFLSNGEFIRYHRGEDFGSIDWIKKQLSYQSSINPEVEETSEKAEQLSLF